MMHFTKMFRYSLAGIVLGASVGSGGFVATTHAQQAAQQADEAKPAATKPVRESGRDPFRRYEPSKSLKRVVRVGVPSIEERIAQYKAQKTAAMNARMVAPKPTTALLVSEMEIVGISRTPRGYAAIVEAKPIKLSYTIYPGERFYDGQLVAIEDNRLVFRRETVLSDGRRERSVEMKPLRQPDKMILMSATKAPTADSAAAPASPAADSAKPAEQPAAAPKPE